MDSINQQQPKDNKKNLFSAEATEKIKQLAEKASSCFFCTNIKAGSPFETRPMAVQQIDEQGNLWFLSADDSNKNEQIEETPKVQLLFQGSHHSDFLSIYGTATLSKDKAKIHELWNPIIKNWFTEGKDAPRITVIKVAPESGYYWDTKHGNAVAFAKQLMGAVIGQTHDDSIEGSLNP